MAYGTRRWIYRIKEPRTALLRGAGFFQQLTISQDATAIDIDRMGGLYPEEIRDLSKICAIVNHEVGELARLERTDLAGAAQAPRSVDSCRGNRLGRGHFHLCAGQRQDHRD